MSGIVWYRADLRVDDHEALAQARQAHSTVKAVFVQQPLNTRRFERGRAQMKFERETLQTLQEELGRLGIELTILTGDVSEQLGRFMKPGDVVYFHRMTGYYESIDERAVLAQFTAHIYETQTLYRREQIGNDKLAHVFSAFRKKVERSGHFEQPIAIEDPAAAITLPAYASGDAFPFEGGEMTGRARLKAYLEGPIFTYKETRNGFGRDDSSKLSAWLANGSLSPRRVMAELQSVERRHGANESTYWLYFELLWRDFFHFTMRETGNRLFLAQGLREGSNVWPTDESIISMWIEGRTGQPFVDAFMHEFRETGWMSNRGRQITASYLIHELGQDWRVGASYFESQLIDYDVASNYGNWAYIAGVGNATRIPRFNPVFQQQMYDPTGAFTRRWTSP